MTANNKSDSKQLDEVINREIPEGVSFALIHTASSLNDFSALSDPRSIEAQVARNRGETVESVYVQENGNEDMEEDNVYDLRVGEGKLSLDSGYVMRFVSEEHLNLTPFDIAGLDSLKAYHAPETLIENLTPRMRGELKDSGYVKVRGAYSPEEKQFYGVKLGWDITEEMDTWDRIMEVIAEVSTTPAAIDYVYYNEGPDKWGVEEIAEARGIAPASVRGNIRSIENEIDD